MKNSTGMTTVQLVLLGTFESLPECRRMRETPVDAENVDGVAWRPLKHFLEVV